MKRLMLAIVCLPLLAEKSGPAVSAPTARPFPSVRR